ncbi:FACT complex subunit SSRP1 [Glycine soja]|nr:FACT complex subunit SSRP1 [Glycine soja]
MLAFMVGSKQAFEVSLADVSQTQLQGKNDVILEFHVDDTTGANEKDSLMEISFHIPNSNTQFVGDENRPPAQVFRDKIMSMADVGAGGEDAVVTFEGQANDFKIQYSSVVRLFLLPKSNQPHTFVIISLDPPIRKGQTLYPHIVMQFETDYVVQSELAMNEDLYNTKYKDKLELSYKGLIHEVFTTILPEDGILYPLEKSFFFLPKPPTLILHEEIDYVEFERHAAGGSNMHYFDLLIRLKSEQEHLFHDDAVDPHLERIKNEAGGDESDEEDSDFVADKDDEGSPTDDSGADDSDGSDSGDEKEASDFENLKKTNPGISFTDAGRVLGEKWKKLSAEEKEPYEAKAREDKKRYKDEISG